jgi:hypothetical protein
MFAWTDDDDLTESHNEDEEIQVGDIIGNTVEGFNFEVITIKGDKLTVKHTKTGKKMDVYNYGSMYKPKH